MLLPPGAVVGAAQTLNLTSIQNSQAVFVSFSFQRALSVFVGFFPPPSVSAVSRQINAS